MAVRTVIVASIVSALLITGCGAEDDSIATSESPVTLGELDDVVVTVAPDDLVGERIRLEDIDGDGEVEIVPPEVEDVASEAIGEPTDGGSDSTVTRIDARGDTDDDDGLNPLGGDDPEDKRMPDLICMGLQDAQNEIQDRGVFFSRSEDATGDGRRQIWDRNWIVVAQDPEPGAGIGENEAVLYVVKNDEDNDC